MKYSGKGIYPNSEIYFHSVSPNARRSLYYPLLAGHFYCGPEYRVQRARYDSFLLLLVVSGNMVLIQNGHRSVASAGELLLMDCYEPHEYFAESDTESLWVHFDGDKSRQWFSEICGKKGAKVKVDEDIAELIRQILRSVASVENEYVLSGKLYSLLCCLAATPEESVPADRLERVRRAREYIIAHLDEDLSVEKIAKSVHLSPSHFSRLFREMTGFSPYDALLNLRLERAKELLSQTSLSVSEVAYRTGFHSDANFIYFFKKETKISPLKFRKLKF